MSILKSARNVQRSLGFTMIELLVVISVIGILAVAVLSAINPIEQINKGRDTSTRSDAGELLSASERYFSIHQVYPWNEPRTAQNPYGVAQNANFSTTYSTAFFFNGPADQKDAAGTWNWLYQLSDTQEVKPAYTLRVINNSSLVVYRAAGSNTSTYVCFAPTSYAFKLEAAKNCNSTTSTRTTPSFPYASNASNDSCATTDGTVPVSPTDNNLICLP
ncbi:hypothetical protein C5B42_04845 [Candidatus Cerribacteria bacterium 'Amazon FNV 2010 28 9']|uniref:Type II secretion system protein GspG C-terminal domain-containing protein n=1 Tax=Candidatus Cerribacteria bacterium 'Amazon FNV 2010 28 9' TaxID=2081795 RepID=A0A317JMX2_9BACT|nr:MAG: hypothetical protein C5B42_04845 [Candidatus Cerribacteria bacterium 'Amazon FNV 2010 28 9']